MEQIRFFANCVCENCMFVWNQEYAADEGDILCPECESNYISFAYTEDIKLRDRDET
jgi:Zn finger protein HypA/HybF involved in hydrogenase expression